MALPPIRLIRHPAMIIDADTPCVLEIRIPISLPHQLDPSLPAPPYHPGTIFAKDFRDGPAMPLLRRLVAGIVASLFGPEHAAAALDAPTRATSPPSGLRLLASWNMCTVEDKDSIDLAAGRWKDVYGDEGHGPIDAYEEDPWGRFLIFHDFEMSLVRWVRDATQMREMNPRVFRFALVQDGGQESEHELVFEVREYSEYFRKHSLNITLALPMEFSDTPAAADGQSQ